MQKKIEEIVWEKIFPKKIEECMWWKKGKRGEPDICLIDPHEDTIVHYWCIGVCRCYAKRKEKRSL